MRSYSPNGGWKVDRRDYPVTGSGGPADWCTECVTPTAMMTPEAAAALCFQTTRAIYRLVEAGRIHFTEGPEGVMVCPASLVKDWANENSMSLVLANPVIELGSAVDG
jgi:hypothetical protein